MAKKARTIHFSKAFGINKSQLELDFVDIPLTSDVELYVDPFAISIAPDVWSAHCNSVLISYFERLVSLIRAHRLDEAFELLRFLREPNETRLGLSTKSPQGAGIGEFQARQLLEALKGSTAVATGFLSSLSECELMVEGIGSDKISDLTTNVLRAELIKYTQDQCALHGVSLQDGVAMPPTWNPLECRWEAGLQKVPVYDGKPIMLVPRRIVRWKPAYNHGEYYQHFVLEYLQAETLNSTSGLVRTLKNGTRRVYKTDLKPVYPLSKEFLYKFSSEHPTALKEYREYLEKDDERKLKVATTEDDERVVAAALIEAFKLIEPGVESATLYHNLIISVLELLFYPNLIYPRKEQPIHDGRKRIDIVMTNAANAGAFHYLKSSFRLMCPHLVFECKNYTDDIANEELDQLTSRFGDKRTQVGLVCCRQFENRALFVKRCRDTWTDGRGLAIPLCDADLIRLLDHIRTGNRSKVDEEIFECIREITFS